MTRYADPISRARAKLVEAQKNLFQAYFSEIETRYPALSLRRKEYVIRGLDLIVNFIKGEEPTSPRLTFLTHVSKKKNTAFDPKKAKEVREQAGLSLTQLAERLDIGRCGQVQIGEYERGTTRPCNAPKGKTPRAYVEWLKEQGYDVFK